MGAQDLLPNGVEATRMKAGNQSQAEPQILLFVLPGRDSQMYERLKRNTECRFAMVSQMLNINHVQKASPQYCSNVCMKVNSKLGGTTSKVMLPSGQKAMFPRPTMIIGKSTPLKFPDPKLTLLGADVSHPSPGSPQPSMAALTMSWDRDAIRYAAACETNGHRVEMLSEANIRGMFLELYGKWLSKGKSSFLYLS
jgi:eukaryotic translation initiation factor 2C